MPALSSLMTLRSDLLPTPQNEEYVSWPETALRQLSVDEVEGQRLSAYIPAYGRTRGVSKITDDLIKQFEIQNGTEILKTAKPSIDNVDENKVLLRYEHDPLRDFYEDYKKRTEPRFFEPNTDNSNSRDFKGDDLPYKTYVRKIAFDRNSGRIDINISTYRFSESDVRPEVVTPIEETERYWYDPHQDFESNVREAWNNGYERSLEEDGRKYYQRKMLKKNLTIMIKTRAAPIYNAPLNERVAIDTLREMITEFEFRKYIKYGFITIRAKNGYTYQVFRKNAHTKVWYKGKLIKEICIRLKSDSKVPPTDNVIAFKVMIEADPDSFEQLGNVYKIAEAA